MDSFTRLLWWLFGSSAGSGTRIRLVALLRQRPMNAFELTKALEVDYSTVRHHLSVLERNRLLETGGPNYGKVYTVAPLLDERWSVLEEILERSRRRTAGKGGARADE